MQTVRLRCIACGRPWGTIYNGVFSATFWNRETREITNHAVSIRQLILLLAENEKDGTTTYLADRRRGDLVQWGRVENGTLSIVSRHGGNAHTNSIALEALLDLMQGTRAHDDLAKIMSDVQDTLGTQLLADVENT